MRSTVESSVIVDCSFGTVLAKLVQMSTLILIVFVFPAGVAQGHFRGLPGTAREGKQVRLQLLVVKKK